MSAETALRAGLLAVLKADTGITALLGGAQVYDGAPRGQKHPFVYLDRVETRPLTADLTEGLEHRVELVALSVAPDRGEAADLLSAMARALATGTPPTLAGHRLVSLQTMATATERLPGARGWRGRATFRAVTEGA